MIVCIEQVSMINSLESVWFFKVILSWNGRFYFTSAEVIASWQLVMIYRSCKLNDAQETLQKLSEWPLENSKCLNDRLRLAHRWNIGNKPPSFLSPENISKQTINVSRRFPSDLVAWKWLWRYDGGRFSGNGSAEFKAFRDDKEMMGRICYVINLYKVGIDVKAKEKARLSLFGLHQWTYHPPFRSSNCDSFGYDLNWSRKLLS